MIDVLRRIPTIPRVEGESLRGVCISSCLSSLQDVKEVVARACKADDVMTFRGKEYPGELALLWLFRLCVLCTVSVFRNSNVDLF